MKVPNNLKIFSSIQHFFKTDVTSIHSQANICIVFPTVNIGTHQCELLWSARSRRWSSEQPIKRRACNMSLLCCNLCGWMAKWSTLPISMWIVISLNRSNSIGCNLNSCKLGCCCMYFKYYYCPNFELFCSCLFIAWKFLLEFVFFITDFMTSFCAQTRELYY